MAHHVVLIPGDGIGPEVAQASKQILAAAGADIRWVERYAGVAALDLRHLAGEKTRDLGGTLGTSAFADSVCARLR